MVWKKDLNLKHVQSWNTTKNRIRGIPHYTVCIQQHIGNKRWYFTVDREGDQILQKNYPKKEMALSRAKGWMKDHPNG